MTGVVRAAAAAQEDSFSSLTKHQEQTEREFENFLVWLFLPFTIRSLFRSTTPLLL